MRYPFIKSRDLSIIKLKINTKKYFTNIFDGEILSNQ